MTPLTPLDAVLDLTAATSQVELDRSVVRLAAALVAAEQITLYHLFQPDGGAADDPEAPTTWVRELPDGDERPITALPHCAAAARSGTPQPLSLPGGGVEVAYPIAGDQGLAGLLTARYPHLPDDAQALLAPLLTCYHHHRRLLLALEHDALTGLRNRQTFDLQIWEVIHAAGRPTRRRDEPGGTICFAMFDIDHFKRVNDTFGHLYGDEVLLLFARLLGRSFRQSDLTYRYGGEEFCVVLFGANLERAGRVLERFHTAVADHPFPQVGQQTVSIGFTQVRPDDQPGDLIDRADRALYFAKAHGRNQLCAYEQLVTDGELADTSRVIGGVELF